MIFINHCNNDKKYKQYQGTGLTVQLQGEWAVINITQTNINANYGEAYTNIIALPPEIQIYDNVGFYTTLFFLTQSWIPISKYALIILEHNKLTMKCSDNISDGVLVGQFMIPKEALQKY